MTVVGIVDRDIVSGNSGLVGVIGNNGHASGLDKHKYKFADIGNLEFTNNNFFGLGTDFHLSRTKLIENNIFFGGDYVLSGTPDDTTR